MRNRLLLAAAAAMLGVAGCRGDQAVEPSFADATSCAWTLTNIGTGAIPAPNNSTRNAGFWIKNTGSVSVTFTGHSASSSGTVTSATPEPLSFPFTLAPGALTDVGVRFTTGSTDGFGLVFYTVTSNCGTKTQKRSVQVS
jgi:archaellum component FlaG (FlaF/FlaG flagellin family)